MREELLQLTSRRFHCEGRIVTTIFGLLFWDIIFAPVLGAFETLYQVAPLDIAEETFYTARQELIQARLGDIKEGKAVELLAASYDQYSAEKRGCVGVRWDLFERQELVEIVQVSLSTAKFFNCTECRNSALTPQVWLLFVRPWLKITVTVLLAFQT